MADDPKKRVFSYFNGVETIFGDPLRIQRDLYLKLGDPDAAFEAAENDKDYYAHNTIVDNAREAFHMAPFDPKTGEGATDEDVEAALAALFEYFQKKSQSIDTKPSSEPSTTSIPTVSPGTP